MLFRKNLSKFCAHCVHAGQVSDDRMLCKKKGFVSPDGHCRRYRYDPLKRIPVRSPVKDFSQFDDQDFSL